MRTATNYLRPNPSLPLLMTCRSQNQSWAITLNQSEIDIDELLSLMADVLEQHYPLPLHKRAVAHYASLCRMNGRIDQLRQTYLCSSNACNMITSPFTCTSTQFGRYQDLPTTFAQFREEFGLVRDTCHQFLSGLLKLNLI